MEVRQFLRRILLSRLKFSNSILNILLALHSMANAQFQLNSIFVRSQLKTNKNQILMNKQRINIIGSIQNTKMDGFQHFLVSFYIVQYYLSIYTGALIILTIHLVLLFTVVFRSAYINVVLIVGFQDETKLKVTKHGFPNT